MKDILRAIAKQTDYNVVVEPDVKGLTTVDLKQVTLPKALEYILEPLNYAYKIEDRTVYVSKPKVETKIFTINYLSLKKTATSKVTWKEGGSSSTTTTSGTTSSEEKTLEIKSETESDLWKSLEDNLKPMLSKDGKLAINRKAFTIMVADYPKNLKSVSLLLYGLEKPMHRQILIEAKIVEVILNVGSRQGVNWSLVNARVGSFANINVTQSFTTPADFTITHRRLSSLSGPLSREKADLISPSPTSRPCNPNTRRRCSRARRYRRSTTRGPLSRRRRRRSTLTKPWPTPVEALPPSPPIPQNS